LELKEGRQQKDKRGGKNQLHNAKRTRRENSKKTIGQSAWSVKKGHRLNFPKRRGNQKKTKKNR